MQQHTQAANINQPSGVEDTSAFCDATCRTRLAKQLSAHRPYVYWTLEFYDEANGIKGGGGLGILAADMRRVAERLQVPFVVVTPFYRQTSHTALQGGHQEQSTTTQTPLEHGYQYIQDTPIHFASHPSAQLAVFTKHPAADDIGAKLRGALRWQHQQRPPPLPASCAWLWRL